MKYGGLPGACPAIHTFSISYPYFSVIRGTDGGTDI